MTKGMPPHSHLFSLVRSRVIRQSRVSQLQLKQQPAFDLPSNCDISPDCPRSSNYIMGSSTKKSNQQTTDLCLFHSNSVIFSFVLSGFSRGISRNSHSRHVIYAARIIVMGTTKLKMSIKQDICYLILSGISTTTSGCVRDGQGPHSVFSQVLALDGRSWMENPFRDEEP